MARKTSTKAHAGTVFMKCLIAFKAGGLVYRDKDKEEKEGKQEKERKRERTICDIKG
jgi:hypothetical protein